MKVLIITVTQWFIVSVTRVIESKIALVGGLSGVFYYLLLAKAVRLCY